MRSRSIALVVLLPVLGCGSASSNDGEASTPPPELGAIITLASEDLRPGDKVSPTFPASDLRGGFFYLYAWHDGEWTGPRFLLESDANGSAPRVVPMDQGMEDYGIDGPGPDGLILPSDIAPRELAHLHRQLSRGHLRPVHCRVAVAAIGQGTR